MSKKNKTLEDLKGWQFTFIKEYNKIPTSSMIAINPAGIPTITFNGGLVDPTSQKVFGRLVLNEVNNGFNYLKPTQIV